MSEAAERISDAIEAPLSDLGVDLESVDVHRAGRRHVVKVVVDRDGGVDLDTVAAVSSLVSGLLDDPSLTTVLPGPFVLEVTSPGVDRPLTEERHWRRAVGRLVEVDLVDGSRVVGRIGSVTSDHAQVRGSDQTVSVAFAQVRRAVVQVEFARTDAASDVDDDSSSRMQPDHER